MKKSVLLPFMMVALLTIGTVATSYGQAKPGMPPAPGTTKAQSLSRLVLQRNFRAPCVMDTHWRP